MPQVSFAGDIKPLFRAIDISHMKSAGVKLDDYTYMSDPSHANKVLATLSSELLLHCRSASMVGAMRQMLVVSSVDEDDIRTEEFAGY